MPVLLAGCLPAPYGTYYRPSLDVPGATAVRQSCGGQAGPPSRLRAPLAPSVRLDLSAASALSSPPTLGLDFTLSPGATLRFASAQATLDGATPVAPRLSVSARTVVAADAVVDLAADDWKDRVKALAGPAGVDVVADPVGGPFTDTAFRTLGWGGRHLVLGFASGSIGQLKGNLTIVKGASLVGVDLRQFREREPAAARALFADVVALHRDGHVKPRVVAAYPFERHAEAFARAADRGTVGRVILRPAA